jgi:hypothetical protein
MSRRDDQTTADLDGTEVANRVRLPLTDSQGTPMQPSEAQRDRDFALEHRCHTSEPPWAAPCLRWGSVLGGAVALLSLSLVFCALAFAVVSLVVHRDAGSMRGTGLALWIVAVLSTVTGGAVGGWSAEHGRGRSTASLRGTQMTGTACSAPTRTPIA